MSRTGAIAHYEVRDYGTGNVVDSGVVQSGQEAAKIESLASEHRGHFGVRFSYGSDEIPSQYFTLLRGRVSPSSKGAWVDLFHREFMPPKGRSSYLKHSIDDDDDDDDDLSVNW